MNREVDDTEKALPSIVANLFASVNDVAELIDSANPNHYRSILPSLIPVFKQTPAFNPYKIDQYSRPLRSGNSEIDLLFPLFQHYARDTVAALRSGSFSLRQRSLKSLVDKLKMLPAQLPEMGLTPQAVKRWQPAIERWQYILELKSDEPFLRVDDIDDCGDLHDLYNLQRWQHVLELKKELEIAEQQEISEREFFDLFSRLADFPGEEVNNDNPFSGLKDINGELEIEEQQEICQGEFCDDRLNLGNLLNLERELLNPFQFGNPLRPNHLTSFKGRQDFIDRLVRLILDRNRPTLVLHGPRRAGKTSFLLNLPRLLPSDLVPIYLDMQQGSMTASEGDFCYGLVRAIDRDTRSQGLQLPPIPSREAFYARPYPTLEDWLDLALPQLGERRLLLNLDEFEKIGSAIRDNRIGERLFDELRSMIQHYDRLGFLFSGVQTLEELGPRWSNYFISVVPMEMHYLEPHEAEDLLINPDPEFTLCYDAGIVDEILHLTRCQPYLLQLIGSALVNQANQQHSQLATTAILQNAIQDAFTNGEPYFTNIWTEFTGTTPAEVTAGQQFLMALAQGNTHAATDEIALAARRRLLRYHVIERIEGDIDKIEIPLFEQWVRERSIQT